MPIFVIVLFLLAGLAGGFTTTTNETPVNESDVIVRTPTGGLVRHGAEVNQTSTGNRFTTNNTTNNLVQNTPTPQPSPSEVKPALPPNLSTLAAQNIDTRQALLRGNVTFPGQAYQGEGFFIYSTSERDVIEISPATSRSVISNYLNRDGLYTRTVTQLDDGTRYYYRICFEDKVNLRCGDTLSFTTVEDVNRYQSYRKPSVSTHQAKDVNAETAVIESSYQLYDAEIVRGFFIYGESQSEVSAVPNEYDEYDDVIERGDNLQKLSIGRRLSDKATVSRELDDLEKSTTYYYSFCIAYDDDNAKGVVCGYPRSFTTKDRQLDEPIIGFIDVSVNGDEATLEATIDMNDYLDGYAFLVYGTNRSSVEGVENRTRYSQIYQNGDALQKITLDTDFDGRDTVSKTIRDLASGFQFYRFCVEYEHENNYYGYEEFVLECSELRFFDVE